MFSFLNDWNLFTHSTDGLSCTLAKHSNCNLQHEWKLKKYLLDQEVTNNLKSTVKFNVDNDVTRHVHATCFWPTLHLAAVRLSFWYCDTLPNATATIISKTTWKTVNTFYSFQGVFQCFNFDRFGFKMLFASNLPQAFDFFMCKRCWQVRESRSRSETISI